MAEKLPRGITIRSGSYLVQASKDGRRLYATCASLAEAVLKQGELKAALLRGGGALEAVVAAKEGRKVWTLQEAFNCTWDTIWSKSKGPKTAKTNSDAVLRFFGSDTKLNAITKERVDEFIEHLFKGGNTGATVNRKLAVLSKMLKEAIKRPTSGYTSLEKPHLDFQKESKGRIRFLVGKEEETLLSYARLWEKWDHMDAIIVLVDTGMRSGELFALRPADVDVKRRVLMIYGENEGTKNGDFRAVPMTARVTEVINRRMETNHVRLFPFHRTGLKGSGNDWMYKFWDKAKVCMGLEDDEQFIPYVLRHTCASRLVQRGAPITFVQKWLGHKTIEQTLRYAKLAPDDLFRVVNLLEPVAQVPTPEEGAEAAE